MSSGLTIDDIIMDLFSDITEQENSSTKKDLSSKIKDDEIYLYQGSIQDYSLKKIISGTKQTLLTHHFIEKEKLLKYFYSLLSIVIDEADI